MDNLIGKRFGRWIVIGSTDHKDKVLARCDCGTEKTVWAGNITTGKSLSCGCFRTERIVECSTTHGHTRVRKNNLCSHTYMAWTSMWQRCTNPKNCQYHNYGGRGIKVCDHWKKFENFLADMGEKPRPDMSIDRIDCNKGYSPDNCRWATNQQQSANRRNNVFIEYYGEKYVPNDLSRITGVGPATLSKWSKSSNKMALIRKYELFSEILKGMIDPQWMKEAVE